MTLNPFRWIQQWVWRRQRALDERYIWPAIKQHCGDDRELAHQIFMVHALGDPAWVRHYGTNLYNAVRSLT